MDSKKNVLSPIKIVAVTLIGLALAWFSLLAIISIIIVFQLKEESPYLYGSYLPLRELLIIVFCIVVFILILYFNIRVKRKWLSAVVNIIVIIVFCNPLALIVGVFGTSWCENDYTVESEDIFNRCAEDMEIDFNYFPKYNEFDDHDVRFVGEVYSGLFFHQSITAIVKYDSLKLCEADYEAYVSSHEFLTEPVVDKGGYYLISAPEFHYDGIFFRVVTAGEKDFFPKKIYMIGIDRDESTLYYLYLDDQDIDFVAGSDAEDLEGEMIDIIVNQFNLGK